MTGEPAIDTLLECGPRVLPEAPAAVRSEVLSFRPYADVAKLMAQNELAEMHREIAFVSKQNRDIENSEGFKASNGIGYPTDRIPVSVHLKMRDIYGQDCWRDPDFKEDFLKHHPGLRVRVTRGTRGQEYAGRTGVGRLSRPPTGVSRSGSSLQTGRDTRLSARDRRSTQRGLSHIATFSMGSRRFSGSTRILLSLRRNARGSGIIGSI